MFGVSAQKEFCLKTIEHRFHTAASRSLGFVDSNPLSITAGCADRNYWHYQDGKGFAVGSFQIVMLGLKMAAAAFPQNSAAYSAASDLAASWWAKKIKEKSLLDEYFANQKSFCATAYTAFAAAAWLNGRAPQDPNTTSVSEALKLALSSLAMDNHRPDSANQSLAARLAFDLAAEQGLVTGGAPFSPRPLGNLGFSEYGGFDLGYSLKCLDLCALAMLLLKEDSRKAEYANYARSLIQAIHLLCVQFTFSPYLGSRGNPHLLLGGLRQFAKSGCAPAEEILLNLKDEERFPSLVGAECCDDKYLAFFHLNSLMLEYFSEKTTNELRLGSTSIGNIQVERLPDGIHTISDLGLVLYRGGSSRAAIAVNRGGAVHFEAGGKIESDLGKMLSGEGRLWIPAAEPVSCKVQNLNNDSFQLTLPIRITPLKQRALMIQSWGFSSALQLALAIPGLGHWIRNRLYKSVNSKRNSRTAGQRTIFLSKDSVVVKDDLKFEFEDKYPIHEWIFTDGHATRMFRSPRTAIQKEGADAI